MKIKIAKQSILTFRVIPEGTWFRWAEPFADPAHYYCKLKPASNAASGGLRNAFELRTGRLVRIDEGQEIVVATIETVEFKE